LFKTAVDTTQSPVFQVNVNLIRRVEYLTENSEWRLLTRDSIAGLTTGQLVCRLAPYQDSRLSINTNKSLTLPLYDENFLIDVGNFVTSATTTILPVRKRMLSRLKTSLEVTTPTEFITTNFGLGYL
jgi:hypothetical protein